jgi:thioredoxin-like negative regulator of GroEL
MYVAVVSCDRGEVKMGSNRLRQAVESIKAGDKAEAQEVLIPILKGNPHNANAWFLLSYTVEGEKRIECLEEALDADPEHEKARKRLAELTENDLLQSIERQQSEKPQTEKSNATVGKAVILALAGFFILSGLMTPEIWGRTLPWVGFFIGEVSAFVVLLMAVDQGNL